MPYVPTVCVVDDDAAVSVVTRELIEAHGYRVREYASGAELLADFDESNVDCVVTDLKMPGMTGLELQARLRARGAVAAVVVMSGYADVKTAVQVMEQGAVTLVEKPFQPVELMRAIDRAVDQTFERRTQHVRRQRLKQQLASLGEEERQVLECILAGMPNKAIAHKLSMSSRTLDRRRSSVLRQLNVDSVAELAALIAKAEIR